ncbi:MFS transporter [Castellaniella sp. GW247-6E4]|uniref:MFS transporter n=1 Tax=Castellaniella sp. GW247-6E4 TaxID=3140380 RepID=UPI00331508DB
MDASFQELLRVRRALFGCFLAIGFAMASWIVRTPSIRDALDASTAQMGMVLFGFSLGSMGGILQAGRIVARVGADRAILAGLGLAASGLLGVAGGTLAASAWLAGLGLGLVGLGMAVSEVAVNVLGAHVERGLSRPVLTAVHGCFSLGTTVGAACGLLIVAWGISVAWHMLVACAILAPMMIHVSRGVAGAPGARPGAGARHAGFLATIGADPRLLLIGLIVVAVALAEGAANDWLPLLIVDAHGASEKTGSLLFTAFAATMTAGRFLGTGALRRFGPVAVMRVSGIIGALGILAVILAPNLYLAGAAVVLWGIGASLGFPVAMSAGAANGPNPAARIGVLATIGYTAFLVGPPMLGFIGERIGLSLAMLVVLGLLAFPIVFAFALGPARGPAAPESYSRSR